MKRGHAATVAGLALLASVGATIGEEPYLRGGLWHIETTFDDVTVPNVPGDHVANTQRQFAEAIKPREVCIADRPAQSYPKVGDPVEEWIGGDCVYTAVERPGEPVARAARCLTGKGHDVDLTLTGTMTPEAYRITARVAGRKPDSVVIATTENGKRVGECPAGMDVVP